MTGPRQAFGIERDVLGQPAAPLLPAPCRCKRPKVQVDDHGERRCIACGRVPR